MATSIENNTIEPSVSYLQTPTNNSIYYHGKANDDDIDITVVTDNRSKRKHHDTPDHDTIEPAAMMDEECLTSQQNDTTATTIICNDKWGLSDSGATETFLLQGGKSTI